jgi:radical SAM superfamily enzyme YgiQ (UPF0313 family)
MGLAILLINVRKEDPGERDYFDGRTINWILRSVRGYGVYPLGLGIVAALTPDRHHVWIVDENIEELDPAVRPDIVGFTAMTWQSPRAYRLAAEFRKAGVYTVMGGIHATILHEEALRHVDTVIVGEAEDVWGSFLKDFESRRPKRLYRAERFIDLGNAPVPRYDLFKRRYYLHDMAQLTRGCPRRCRFCSVHKAMGGTVRLKPVDRMARELEFLREVYRSSPLPRNDRPVVFFADDDLAIDPMHLERTVEQLEARALVPEYVICETSMETLRSKHTIRLLERLNVIKVFIGFESLAAETLRDYGKAVAGVAEYRRVIVELRERGIEVMGSFIVGGDQETEADFGRLRSFIDEMGLISTLINILTPYPGTRLFNEMKRTNRILSEDWSQYDIKHTVFRPKHLTAQRLRDLWLQLHLELFQPESYIRRFHRKVQQTHSRHQTWRRSLTLLTSAIGPLARSLSYQGALPYLLKNIPFLLANKMSTVDGFDMILGIDAWDFTLKEQAH